MSKYINSEFATGLLILTISGLSLFVGAIPVIWIGGFLWGGGLIVSSFSTKKRRIPREGEVEKEIVVCGNCKNRIRVPVDRKRYVDIICPHCRKSPFLGFADKFSRISKKIKLLFTAGVILLIGLGYVVVASSLSSSTSKYNIVADSPALDSPKIDFWGNGQFLFKNYNYLNGLGSLQISNGTGNDAVAKLVNVATGKSIATVYVNANSNYVLKNISDGSYKLVFSLGRDWDTINRRFIRNLSYSAFDESFDFRTYDTSEDNYIDTHYSTYRVTLNPVISGTAKTSDINLNEFNKF